MNLKYKSIKFAFGFTIFSLFYAHRVLTLGQLKYYNLIKQNLIGQRKESVKCANI